MKKFAAGLLTALCATAIATAQPADQATEYTQQPVSTQAAPAQTAAPQAVATEAQANEAMPIDEQPAPPMKRRTPSASEQKPPSFTVIFGDLKNSRKTIWIPRAALVENSASQQAST